MSNNDPLARLTGLLSRMPGIGEKTALRLALWLTKAKPDYLAALADLLRNIKTTLRECEICRDICSSKICDRCRSPKRDHTTICVVARPQDRMAIERSGYNGAFHVLHGELDPLAGVGPDQIRLSSLLNRLRSNAEHKVKEIILATSPNVTGDATAMYIDRIIGPVGVRVTRIASGVAVGGELEYADSGTLNRALADRREISQ